MIFKTDRLRLAGMLLSILVVLFIPSLLFPAGPLRGKLLDVPQQIYYSFPGFSAASGLDRSLRLGTQAYYLNEFRGYAFNPEDEARGSDGRLSDDKRIRELTAMDFEALVTDAVFSFPWGRDHRCGITLRLYSYFGGFFDPVIEGFHSVFGFPNASREYFPQGRTSASIVNDRGVRIEMDGPSVFFGDTEIFGVWTFAHSSRTTWALAWALELPTGPSGTPGGNGHVDAGGQLLYQRFLGGSFMLHVQQGFVVPGELLFGSSGSANPFVLSQSLLGLEWLFSDDWSFLGQTRIHTSPLSSSAPLNHSLFSGPRQFEMPVTSLQLGLRRAFAAWDLQIYLEQDFLTHEGPDILVSMAADWRIGRGY